MTFLIHRNRHKELDKMRRKKNMSQMKEQDKTRTKKLSEMRIRNMPDRKFKVMLINTFTSLEKRVEDLSEMFNKKIENVIKKKQR